MYSRNQIRQVAQAVLERVEAEAETPLPNAYLRYALRRLALEKEQISENDFEVFINDLNAARWPAADVAQALMECKPFFIASNRRTV